MEGVVVLLHFAESRICHFMEGVVVSRTKGEKLLSFCGCHFCRRKSHFARRKVVDHHKLKLLFCNSVLVWSRSLKRWSETKTKKSGFLLLRESAIEEKG